MDELTDNSKGRTLNARSALSVVALYLLGSIAVTFFVYIFSGGANAPPAERLIDGVVGRSLVANLIVMVGVLYVSTQVFKHSRRDIFYERQAFSLSKAYYLFPLAWFGAALLALTQVDYTAYSLREILLTALAALAIGVNEEIITRGILLVGLRNSKVNEWLAWIITLLIFAALHLVNVFGGANLTIVIVVLTGGTLLYAARRIFGNLFLPIGLHAIYDTAFYLLSGKYALGADLPGPVLDIQLGTFLFLLLVSILFPILGRKLFKQETTGWPDQAAV